MSINRRDVVKAVALGGAVAASGAAGACPGGESGAKLVHHVFFWLKRPDSTADRDQLIAGLRSLAHIPVIRSLEIGVPAPTEQREVVDASFHVSELMVFDNAADQKAYQDHPIHLDFVAKHSHLWGKVVVYDMMTV